jgi:hypothetical protein
MTFGGPPREIDDLRADTVPPRPEDLATATLLVPVRSSTGEVPDPSGISIDDFRHGTDDAGERFLAAFTSREVFAEFGPPGSDHVALLGRDLFTRAESAGVRVVVDPGAPGEVEISGGLMPYLAAGIDPNRPDALRARRPVGDTPDLEPPGDVPETLAGALRAALDGLSQVERAWLLRAGEGWTLGVQLTAEAVLADFDEVRNRLHAVATEQLGSRRLLAVTDVRAPALRDAYDATAAPFYVRRPPDRRGMLARLLGR